MNKERLLKLAEFLESDKVPQNKFDMEGWATNGFVDGSECGSAACACGWATTIPEFRQAGFCLIQHTRFDYAYEPPKPRIDFDIEYGDLEGWRAAEAFFELSTEQCEYLFWSGTYPESDEFIKPIDVATRIRDFVKDNS